MGLLTTRPNSCRSIFFWWWITKVLHNFLPSLTLANEEDSLFWLGWFQVPLSIDFSQMQTKNVTSWTLGHQFVPLSHWILRMLHWSRRGRLLGLFWQFGSTETTLSFHLLTKWTTQLELSKDKLCADTCYILGETINYSSTSNFHKHKRHLWQRCEGKCVLCSFVAKLLPGTLQRIWSTSSVTW